MLANLGLDRYGVTTRSQRQYRYLQSPEESITNEEISAVTGTYKEYPCSAVLLETILDKRPGIKIPHNIIHKILKTCFKRY
jgi:hypothetical protein